MKKSIMFLLLTITCFFVYADNTKKWLSIDFDHAGGITLKTLLDKSEIKKAFPSAVVKEAKVYSYSIYTKGFEIYLNGEKNPVFYISSHYNSDYGKDNIFSVFTKSSLVKGPNDATIGKTTYKEMKDLRWSKSVDAESGCGFGLNSLKNKIICVGPTLRGIFVAPSGYKKELQQAPADIIDNAVLSELMFYPKTSKDSPTSF